MKKISKLLFAAFATAAGSLALAQEPVQKTPINQPVLGVVGRSTLVGHADPDKVLHVAISMPWGDPAGIAAFNDDVSNPKSPNYRHFLTPQQVGERFGISSDAVDAIKSYYASEGFNVTLVGKNRLTILADATVSQVENAFNTTINNYKVNNPMEAGNAEYFAYATPPQVPTTLKPYISGISGIESFTKPHTFTTLDPTMTRTLYSLAGTYGGGTQGQGRKIAISNWVGYRLNNVQSFYSTYGLPTPSGGVLSNIHQVKIDGADGTTASENAEADLDIQMELGQAPLADLYIYDNAGQGDLVGVLTQEVNDNLADVISESYGWSLDPTTASSCHSLHQSMTAQGITYMAAAGDSGTSIEPYSYPDFDPEVLIVGGTVATTDASGNRVSEVTWNGGGGGWSTHTDAFNVLPSWQVGNGVPTTNNHRLIPDVALHASGGGGGAYFFYLSGNLSSGYVGTSFACPVFAGGLGTAEQQLIANGSLTVDGSGHYRLGRLQDLVYLQNGNSSIWYDITSGSNGTLPDNTVSNAHAGWDYADGWGAVNWVGFINSFGPNLKLSTYNVQTGSPITGTVTIVGTAGVGGTNVSLSSDSGAASVPSSVNVPQNSSSQTFSVTTANTGYTKLTAHITATFPGSVNRSQTLTVDPSDYAAFVSQTVPTSMVAGEHYTVTLQFKNNGATTWDSTHQYKIHSMSPANNTTWGTNRIPISGSAGPGQTGTFTASIVAPLTAGTYNFQWQMIQDDIGFTFGPSSTNVAVAVTKAADASQIVSQTNVPTTINAGTDFTPSLTWKNVGTNTWSSAGGYMLKSRNPYNNTTWGTSSVALTSSVSPGGTVTLTPTFTAPITAGTYYFQWSWIHGATLFGDLPNTIVVNVVVGANDAKYISQTGVYTSVGPSTTFTPTITMQNLGTATWDSTYSLVSRNPANNTTWGTSSVAVTGTVAQNANAVFSHTFTAPSTPGTYNFSWRMSVGGVAFGQQTPNVSIVVSADAAHFVSNTGPTTVNAGQDFYISNTMLNTGTTSWSGGTGYSMMSVNPNNNTTWGRTRNYLSGTGSYAPGASAQVYGLCTAPTTPGTYTMQWQMDKNGAAFGEKTPLISMTVVLGADDASFVSQTGVPTSIVHGTTFNATITMKNLGTATWSGPTYSLVSTGSNNFGHATIAAVSTAQNATDAFTATFTAPATPGTYTFQYRMEDGTTKFGASTTKVTITVT